MAFSVGDIESRLVLDRTPFTAGLDRAREDVKRFEDERHVVTEHVDLKGLEEAKAELQRLHAEQEDKVRVNVDDARAKAELDRLKLELDRLNHERVTPTVRVDTNRANADIRTLTGSVTRLGAVASVIGRSTMPMLIAGLVGLAPAVVPLAGAATAAFVGMGGAMAAAGAGTAAFGLVAKSVLTSAAQNATKLTALQDQYNQAVDNKQRQQILKQEQVLWSKIPPEQRQTVMLMQQLQAQWEGLGNAARPFVNRLLAIGVQISGSVRPAIQGLVTSSGAAFVTLAHQAQTALAGPFWQQFLRFIQGQARPAILAFGGSFGNVAHGMAALTMAFAPLEQRFLAGMTHMTGAFQQWASTLANSRGFQQFMAAIQADIPVVMGFLKAFGGAAIQLVKALEPVGRAILAGLTPVFQQLARDMPAIAPGFAALGRFAVALLRNIEPLIPAVARLLVALEPLATTVVNALGTALRGLEPAFAALIKALVPVAQTLMPVLADVIVKLAPIVAQLVRALAPFVVTLARMAAAILPQLVPFIGQIVKGFVQFFAAIRPLQGPLIQLAVAVGRLFAAVAPVMGQMMAATLPFVKLLVAGLSPAIRLVADLLNSSFGKALFAIMALLTNPLGAALAVGKAAFNAFGDVVHAVANAVVAAWKWVEGAVTAVWHTMESVGKAVFTAIQWAVMHLTPVGWIISNWHAISSAVTSVWHALQSAASSVWHAIESAITGPIKAVSGFLGDAWRSIKSAASDAWHSVLGVARSVWNSVSSAISSPIKSVVSWLGGIVIWFFNAGKNIVEGLISGVVSMGGWLVNKLVDIVKGAFSGVLHFLGISSPSTLFHGVGTNMIAGMARGILAAGPQVQAALNRTLGGLRVPTLTGTVGATMGPGSAAPAIGTVGGGGITVQGPLLHVDRLDASNPADIGRVQQALLTTARQITRAQGRRGG